MLEFNEVAIQLRNITHSYESDFSVEALLKKRKRPPVVEQPMINVNHLNNHHHFRPNGSSNHINGGAYLNGGASQPHNYTNLNDDDVQTIYLNQSKNFPSFYFRQNENNNYENYNRNHNFKSPLSPDSTSGGKKLFNDSSYSKRNVLNNLNMTIPKSAIYGLLGPSGCGKTTILKMITGIIKPDKGGFFVRFFLAV